MMRKRVFNMSFRKTIIIFSATFLFAGVSLAQAQSNNPSQKTTVVNGKTFIEHSVSAKDTYYQLSRIYGIPVKDIMNANNKKNLRVGDSVYIPYKEPEKKPDEKPHVVQNNTNKDRESKPLGDPNGKTIEAKILTEYKVGSNETLFSIAKRFSTTVDNIKKLNGLNSDTLQEGQTLKIPDGDVIVIQKEVPSSSINLPIPDNISKEEIEFETNRYGIREKKEKGIGIWMENLESGGRSNLALHRTAPVGTILKITNPLTKSVTFAKVVGKFSDTAESRDAIVILSKSAASYIGALDKRFLIEIAYGAPVN
ncbi:MULTISPECIES: DPBB and LysM peptidoglycan-binding domain-containing protein [Sphingobacterium]|uniref:DPBB and LysM peptidoglycan-binding domain-containing protein n=1 Tax=Sphingobacterium TaxID=28453 RepID=UPI00240DA804|nr:LysM peptidoglycan-binding domain-containing protein [Sphingobacterium sp. WM]WFB64512.1 LysM peptidoglycan-binding domain-containing protein [Sphingobacterium sp. WM]